MQDDWTNKEMTDRAWANMSSLLDREMPVKPVRKRRPLIWWVLLIGILLAGGWWWWTSSSAEVPVAPNVHSRPIAETETTSSGSSEVAANSPLPIQDTEPEQSTTSGEENPSHTEIPSEGVVDSSTQLLSSTHDTRMDPAESLIEPVDMEASGSQPEPLESTLQNNPSSEEAVTKAADRITPAAVTALPGRPTHPLDLPTHGQVLSPAKKPAAFHPDWHLGINSGAGYGTDGLFTEARTSIPLGRRFAIQAGTGIRYTELSLRAASNSTDANHDAGQPLGNSGGGGTPAQDPSRNTLSESQFLQLLAISDIRLQSLLIDLPLVFQYRFAHRWSVEAGARAAYRVHAGWQNTGRLSRTLAESEELDDLMIAADQQQFSVQSTAAAVSSTVIVNNWQWAATAGLTYRLTPQYQLRLQYQHALNGIFQQNRLDLYNRRLWFSVGYRF